MIGQNGHHVVIPKAKKSSRSLTDTERISIVLERRIWIMNFKNVPIRILLGRNGLIVLTSHVEAKVFCSDQDKCAKATLMTKLRTLLAALDTLVKHVIRVTQISTYLKIIAQNAIVTVWDQNLPVVQTTMALAPAKLDIPESSVKIVTKDSLEMKKATALNVAVMLPKDLKMFNVIPLDNVLAKIPTSA